jgi:hypothetical protein
MNERIKELARKADFYVNDSAKLGHVWCSDQLPIDENLEEFAKLVRDDALEEAAKVCGIWNSCHADEIRQLKDKP